MVFKEGKLQGEKGKLKTIPLPQDVLLEAQWGAVQLGWEGRGDG